MKIALLLDSQPLSCTDVFGYWERKEIFRKFWIELLASIPFKAFRWELPAMDLEQLHSDFECVLLEDESLHRAANCAPFVDQFITSATT